MLGQDRQIWTPSFRMHSLSDRFHPMLVEKIVIEISLLILDYVTQPHSWHTSIDGLIIQIFCVTYAILTRFQPEEASSAATIPTDHHLLQFAISRIWYLRFMSWPNISPDASSWDQWSQGNNQRWSQLAEVNSVTSGFSFMSGHHWDRIIPHPNLRSMCGPPYPWQAIRSNSLVSRSE